MTAFAMEQAFAKGLPDPAPRWKGFPRHNFVGGHNDPTLIPVEGLIDAAASVLRREGANLAMYNLSHGPQGYTPLREFVADKAKRHRGIACGVDDVLITSGSLQGIDLVNSLLLTPGDTVLVEEFSYGGAISKLKKSGMKIVGMPLDDDGIRIDALGNIL
ncbi:MAG: aminotransferase class I/II-fold pyridoxal phosphate-dependent enzyme, partial [Acetobacteraceae bacterium]